jgi:predicted nucleic acid-binding protein
MSDRYFLDTNVFVYCFDESNRRKHQKANDLVLGALRERSGLISSQVIQEFLNVATRKFTKPMTGPESRAYLQTVLAPLCEVFASVSLYEQALSIQSETNYSFYDSLMIAAAIEGRCRYLYSEDLQSGHTIRGLTIKNPFAS